MRDNIFSELQNLLGKERLRENVLLSRQTTLKIGGPAQYYFEAESEDDLIKSVIVTYKLKIPITILGGGSNVLIGAEGVKGLVVRNLVSYKKIIEENEKQALMQISSGYSVTRLAKETANMGLAGLEYHFGLPGTIGGALFMNSKWTKPLSYIGDNLVEAALVDESGALKIVDRDYFNFGYDQSILQNKKEYVIWARFRLKKENKEAVEKRAKEYFLYRKSTQPMGVASSGCFFKNYDGRSAGELIDKMGLKGMRIGDAQVSQIHGNFIINRGSASFKDVEKLIAFIKEKALKEFNVKLEEEVVLLK